MRIVFVHKSHSLSLSPSLSLFWCLLGVSESIWRIFASNWTYKTNNQKSILLSQRCKKLRNEKVFCLIMSLLLQYHVLFMLYVFRWRVNRLLRPAYPTYSLYWRTHTHTRAHARAHTSPKNKTFLPLCWNHFSQTNLSTFSTWVPSVSILDSKVFIFYCDWSWCFY